MDQVADPVPPDRKQIPEMPVKTVCIPGPVEHEGLALYRLQVHKSPVTAVSAVIPIITHHEQRIFRHNYWPEIIPRRRGVYIRIKMDTIGILQGLAVDNYLFVDNFNPVAFYTDNPFDIIKFRVSGVLEDNNIISDRLLDWNKNAAGKGIPDAIDEFVYQDMIADQKARNHGAGWYFEGLNHKCPDKEGKQQGNDNGLNILSKNRLMFFRGQD